MIQKMLLIQRFNLMDGNFNIREKRMISGLERLAPFANKLESKTSTSYF